MLISDHHAALYREYYARNKIPYGINCRAEDISNLVSRLNAESLLDYGCGVGARLENAFPFMDVRSYDPGVPELAAEPQPADIVACLDVLEHVEPEYVDAVIAHILLLAKKAVYLTISCQESGDSKLLPDGTKWHTFVREHDWWKYHLLQFECKSKDTKTFVGVWIK